ncbi:MAG: hemerythrin domain-containing protein [Aquabacterium sp.]
MKQLHTPPPSFEEPIEMLQACHEKVRHFARLAPKVAAHVAQHGADQQARDAAQAIMRYFDLAAPLHHQDEEEDLFPALTSLHDAALNGTMDTLTAEHDQLAGLWRITREWLVLIEAGQTEPTPPAIHIFAQAYSDHADREEREVYPHAKRLSAALLWDIGTKMAQRRQIN